MSDTPNIQEAIKNKLPTLGRKSPTEEAEWAAEKRENDN